MTDQPGYTPERIVRRVTLRRRLGVVAVGLAGLGSAAFVTLLWATEPPGLPARTRVAFAGLILVGLGWAGFAAWSLTRRPLFALDRVVAGRLATGFAVLLTAGCVLIAATRHGTGPALAAAVLGAVLTAAAGAGLGRAHAYRRELTRRRSE